MQGLGSPSRVEVVPPVVEAWSLNHWTTGEILVFLIIKDNLVERGVTLFLWDTAWRLIAKAASAHQLLSRFHQSRNTKCIGCCRHHVSQIPLAGCPLKISNQHHQLNLFFLLSILVGFFFCVSCFNKWLKKKKKILAEKITCYRMGKKYLQILYIWQEFSIQKI